MGSGKIYLPARSTNGQHIQTSQVYVCNEESVRDNFLCDGGDGGGNSLYLAVSILCKCYVNYTILYMAFGRVILTYIYVCGGISFVTC
jgi:hypothetical protein